MKNQGHMTLPKYLLVSKDKDMKIYDLHDKELKTIVLRKFNELQQSSEVIQ